MGLAVCVGGAGVVFGASGCAREAAPAGAARAELAFAAPLSAGAGAGAGSAGCAQVGPSHISVLRPPVLDRLREEASLGRRSTAEIAGGHSARAWLAGTVEEGYRVQVVELTDGAPVGPVVDVADDEGGVVGRPELTFAADGTGEVTYLASTQEEFRLVSTPIRCTWR
jgi:hypothetical protein